MRIRTARSGAVSAALLSSVLLSPMAAGCAPSAPVASTSNPAPRRSVTAGPDKMSLAEPVVYQWLKVDGGGYLSTSQLIGRVTLLSFITSYDVTSQAQIRYVSNLARDHVPRLNVVAVVLETAEYQPIVAAYASALELKFPVVLADAATIRGEGPFAGLRHVPSFAILDREGRERFRHLGAMSYAQLEAAVRRVEDDSGVPRPP